MKDILINKLLDYIRENNPDLLLQLEEDGAITNYVLNKLSMADAILHQQDKKQPEYIIEETCMNLLTQDLRPSKFNYIKEILEEEFETTYQEWLQAGVAKFEVVNLIKKCNPVFDDLNFSEENEDNQFLMYCIIGTIGEYLEENVMAKKSSESWVITAHKN